VLHIPLQRVPGKGTAERMTSAKPGREEKPASATIATLGVTVAILLTAIFVATPGQDHRAPAAEIALIGVAMAAMVIVGARQQRSAHTRRVRSRRCFCFLFRRLL
jgi:peptidoglycan/LPS O-acetylase OafA/YrhL